MTSKESADQLSELEKELCTMMTYCRPAFSATEEQFIADYIDVLPNVKTDGYGNRLVIVGNNPTVLFSCHTDTVHRIEGKHRVLIDPNSPKIAYSENANCLGADDTTGCFLARNMILSGIPGLYVFHRAEEVGGRGSAWLTYNTPDVVKNITHAIAFDRKDYTHVITHQGGRCCSDEFAKDLSTRLGLDFAPNSHGVFTDTANYTDLVGECTNLSVGYHAQHTHNEVQDITFAIQLLNALLDVNWDKLVSKRKAGEVERFSYGPSNYYDDWDIYSNYMERKSDARFQGKNNRRSGGTVRTTDYGSGAKARNNSHNKGYSKPNKKQGHDLDIEASVEGLLNEGLSADDFIVDDWEEAYDLVSFNPIAAADLIFIAYYAKDILAKEDKNEIYLGYD